MSEVTNELASDALDREQIDLLLSLDDGAGNVLAEIVGEYLVLSDGLRPQLLAAVGAGDLETAQRVAHTLKGASANVGANRLAGVCAEFEAHAREANTEGTMTLVDRFETECSTTLAALRAMSQQD
jgi:HPt (histidine-containing phosphotransfer) domain-containing protein